MRFLALFLFALPAFAQSFSFGVKGGVPLTDAFSTGRRDPLSYSSVRRRYTVGPTAEIRLPLLGLSVEVDALYHRIGWDSSRAGTPVFEPFQSTARIGAWDFSAPFKRRLGLSDVHPYLAAGPAFRRFFTTRENYVSAASRNLSKQMIDEVHRKNIAGIVAAAGVELGRAMRIAPEFRYTRWLMNNISDSNPFLSTQANQAEVLVLVSVTFGGR